jgi:hypothetical protein
MKELLNLILDPLKEVYTAFAKFFPNVLAMLIIILAGIIIARVVRYSLIKLLSAVSFDSWSDRMGLTSVMRKGDLWSKPSVAFAAMVFWFLIVVAFMAGMSALKVQAIDSLVSQFVLYLPRVISAVLILVFGYIVTGFFGRAILIWAVNRGYHFSKLLAEAVRLLLVVLFVAMALEQLQVAPSIVVAAFSIIFGGIILALAISFGVGGIDAARKIIGEEAEKKQESKRDIEHI